MTRKSFFLMLVAASAVGVLGLYAASVKKLRIPNVGMYKVSDLYKIIRTNAQQADFILAFKDIATNAQKKRGIHIYEPMTADECVNNPGIIAGSFSLNRSVANNKFQQLKGVLRSNLNKYVELTSNPNLLKVLAKTRFLTETRTNTKLIQKFVAHKNIMGKSMTRDQLIAAYGRVLLSFDLADYRFFLVDPFPPAATATAQGLTYPVVNIMSKWQF